jgi:LPS O-antigen subunit length determinant protein (WzzB/FepE family)
MRSIDMNRRSLTIVLLALVAGVVLLATSFLVAQRWCARHVTSSADDLDWLRQEFRLSAAELARVRELHEGYLPQCAAMCQEIAA